MSNNPVTIKSNRNWPIIAVGFVIAACAVFTTGLTMRLREHASAAPMPHFVSEHNRLLPTGVQDCGQVLRGEIIKINTDLVNRTDDVLRIALGPPSCGCTVAALSQDVLARGEHTTMSCEIDTSHRQGAFTISVPLFATGGVTENNDVKRSVEVLELGGSVSSEFGLREPVSFGELRQGARAMASMPFQIIYPSRNASVASADWLEQLPYISYNLLPTTARGEDTVIDGTIKVDVDRVPDGTLNFTDNLKLAIQNGSVNHVIAVPVTGFIGREVQADPKILYWDNSDIKPPQTIKFDCVNGGVLEIGDVRVRDASFLTWTIINNGSAKPELVVSLLPRTSASDLSRTEISVDVREKATDKSWTFRIPALAL